MTSKLVTALAFAVVPLPALASNTAAQTPMETTDMPENTSIMPYEKQYAEIEGLQMAYVDVGEGDPIVFLHGNPTSSYLWRNVMPHLEGRGRLIAPDLIGMGDSEKLPDSGETSYRFVEHRKYLHALLDHLGVDANVTLVVHDWGSGLGFDWARANPDKLKGIVFMEAIVAPIPDWDAFPEGARDTFKAFRSPAGEELILQNNMFVEGVLPGAILRDLTEEEMAEYRQPYLEAGESRRPTLSWPRELPIAGAPSDVVGIVEAYGAWLQTSEVPKLFINAEPGAILTGPARVFVRSWPNLTEVTVKGAHFIQEDSPDEIGQAIAEWLPE